MKRDRAELAAQFIAAVIGMVGGAVLTYGLVVGLSTEHHDLSDLGTGLFALCAAVPGGFIGAFLAAVLTGAVLRRRRRRSVSKDT